MLLGAGDGLLGFEFASVGLLGLASSHGASATEVERCVLEWFVFVVAPWHTSLLCEQLIDLLSA